MPITNPNPNPNQAEPEPELEPDEEPAEKDDPDEPPPEGAAIPMAYPVFVVSPYYQPPPSVLYIIMG